MTAPPEMSGAPAAATASMDLSAAGRRPTRTFFRLLDATVWNQMAMGLLYFVKASPGLLLPVRLAESIRVVGGRRLRGGFAPRVDVWGLRGDPRGQHPPARRLHPQGPKRLRAMELRLRAALVRRLQQLSMA